MEKDYHPAFRLDIGVPAQGFLLGPLLFVIYIEKCLSVWCSRKVACTSTIQSSTTLGPMLTLAGKIYKRILNQFNIYWLTSNSPILNHSKTKGILWNKATILQTSWDFVLQIQGKDIEWMTKFNYLGIMLDEQLHWKEHIDSICNKVNKRIKILARIWSCRYS